MKNNDEELIKRVLAGDDDAFSVLVRKYQKQVHALAWRKIGDFHIAEEITQDTFLIAYKRLTTLKDPQRFVGWLYVITANCCSTWLRKKRLQTQSLEHLDQADKEQLETAAYSEFVVEENERISGQAQRDVAKKLLAKLGESERTVMTLHYFGEMSCPEIGAFLGVSANTVKSRLRRAQQRLQKEETMIREALDNFKITPNLTETIMREISRIKPAISAGNKPFVPWAVAASTFVVVLFMLGFGSNYLAIYQKPYSLDSTSEMAVEIVDTPIVANLESRPDVRAQIGSVNALDKRNDPEQQPNNAAALSAEAQAEETVEDDNIPVEDYAQWELPKAAKARLGKGGINDLQFSPDGTLLAVGSTIGVWLYDVKTGKELSMFPSKCQSLTFSPDGRFLANGGGRSSRNELQLWEVASGRKVALTDTLSSASVVRFSENGKVLTSVGVWGNTIRTLDVETGESTVKNFENRSAKRITLPEPYALTHDKFAVGGRCTKIELWDVRTGKMLSIYDEIGEDKHVIALEFSPDGTHLASVSKNASGDIQTTLRLWDTTSNDKPIILRHIFQKQTGWTNVLAFSPDGKILASGSTDKNVQLWDTATGRLFGRLTEHINGIAALTFSPDGTTLVSASTDGEVLFWSTQTKKRLPIHITGHTKRVKAAAFLNDNTTLASVAFNGIISLWDLKTSQISELHDIGYLDLLTTAAFSPDRTKLVSIGGKGNVLFEGGLGHPFSEIVTDNYLRLTDVRTGQELTNLKTSIFASEIVFSPQGKAMAFCSYNVIRVWNMETDTILNIPISDELNIDQDGNLVLPLGGFLPHTSEIKNALIFSPDGRQLVSGTNGGRVDKWDAESGVELTSFTIKNPRREQITDFSFSSNGVLLSVGSTKRIYIMGSKKLTLLREIDGGTASLMFSPDDTMLVSGLWNGEIEIWDVEAGSKLTTLDGHSAPVEMLVFSPDSKTLVSTGQDGTILVWDWDEVLKSSFGTTNN